MHIHKITLKNYKPFYDEQSIELDTKADQPLVLIGAKNDRGKSALFSGVKYCLYGFEGNPPKRGKQRKKAINRRAIRERQGECFVRIVFQHNNDAYEVTRYITFTAGFDDEEEVEIGQTYPTVKRNGEKIITRDDKSEEYNELMNTILPENASKFFLFDAEADLKKYTQSGADVREAIETVLGIQELRNASSDLDKAADSFQKDFLSAQTDAENRRRLKQQLDDLTQERKALEERKEKKEKELEEAEQQLANIEDEIEDIEEVAKKREELQDIERRIEDADSDRLRAEKKLNKIVRNAGLSLAALGANHIESYDKPEVSHQLESVVTQIIEDDPFDGECVCGEPLTEQHKEQLRTRIKRDAHPAEKFRIALDDLKDSLPDSPADAKRDYTEWREERNQKTEKLQGLQSQADDLEDEIDAITQEDHEDLKERRDETEKRISDLEDEIEGLQKQIGKKENEEDQKNKRIQSLGGATEDEKRLEKLKQLSNLCSEAMEEVREEFVEKRRNEVQQEASRVFQRLTNKPDVYEGIVLDNEYNLRIKTESGLRDVETQSPSAGQTQIIAYSFIAGLNNYTAREAPVIIDTPLGRLDPIHKDALISYYPQFSNQVVILYQPGELSVGDTDVMSQQTSHHKMIRARGEDPETSEFAQMDQTRLREE